MQTTYLLTYPGGMEGWVDLSDWLYTEMVYLSIVTHPNSKHLVAELTISWSRIRRHQTTKSKSLVAKAAAKTPYDQSHHDFKA